MSRPPPDPSKQYFLYAPSLVAEIVFCVTFFLSVGLHTFQLIKYRSWYFLPFVIGGYFEAFGYIAKAILASETPYYWEFIPELIQALLTLLAPTLFAASIYMLLTRIIRLSGGQHSFFIPATLITKCFVSGDVLSFLFQAIGGAKLVGSKSKAATDLGRMLILIGLFIQLAFFGFFILASLAFHLKMQTNPKPAKESLQKGCKNYFFVLYSTSVLILIRSIFRTLEYILGNKGPLQKKEVYGLVFDALAMLVCMLIYNAFHPARVLVSETKYDEEPMEYKPKEKETTIS
ncbi:hypothetical protein O181_015091 [Austropuccinia psidii MF-1]|uniref:RTA1 like protein n=1 Tax=Austropuccinia psidii MF-1 TaxID=1389203 RepID=A0A9Q3GPS3_9BASI|nr:hypothetical protein [Austropuccinia psidii MF-1]